MTASKYTTNQKGEIQGFNVPFFGQIILKKITKCMISNFLKTFLTILLCIEKKQLFCINILGARYFFTIYFKKNFKYSFYEIIEFCYNFPMSCLQAVSLCIICFVAFFSFLDNLTCCCFYLAAVFTIFGAFLGEGGAKFFFFVSALYILFWILMYLV